MRSNLSVINVYNKKNTKSKLVTQLLYGESFKIIKKNGPTKSLRILLPRRLLSLKVVK